jgi:cytochrome c-type biogenesis protein CcmH/NrfF
MREGALGLRAPASSRPAPKGLVAAARERRNLLGIILAVLVAAVFLAIGSVHPPASNAQQRIAYLESQLKCPSCADLSIAQSRDNVALALDAEVARDVHAGMTNAAIESSVLRRYPGSILVPQGGLGVLVVVLPLAAVVLGAVALVVVLWRRRARHGLPQAAEDDEALVAAALRGERG